MLNTSNLSFTLYKILQFCNLFELKLNNFITKMENSLDINAVCRTCLTTADIYKSLYDANIANMINECSFIKVK